MGKSLSEMTLEELWQLFPIFLTEHQECWKDWYEEEKGVLESILPEYESIHHIGSTAINNIWAKPIIDILVVIPSGVDMGTIRDSLVSKGYICMSESDSRISLNKGYTKQGFADRVFHIHLRYEGDTDEIIFRDYLNSDPQLAKEYEALKLNLWKKYEHDRDGYTDAKTEFVKRVMAKASIYQPQSASLKPQPLL